MINWQGTVVSQYNQSPTIQTLLYAFNQWLDPTKDIQSFLYNVWEIDTATGYGLDVWGRIVAVERVLKVGNFPPYFGFEEAGTITAWPFNQGIFYSGEDVTHNVRLQDPAYRILVLAKAAFNITNGSIPAINAILLMLFPGRGRVYVIDNGKMSMTYVFEFVPTLVEQAIIAQSGVMPKPTGVSVSFMFGSPVAKIGGKSNMRASATKIP